MSVVKIVFASIGTLAALVTLVGVGVSVQEYLSSTNRRIERLEKQTEDLDARLQVIITAPLSSSDTENNKDESSPSARSNNGNAAAKSIASTCSNLAERTAKRIVEDGFESSAVGALKDLMAKLGCVTL